MTESKNMAKRSAYKAEIDDNTYAAKRSRVDKVSQRIFFATLFWPDIRVLLRKYFTDNPPRCPATWRKAIKILDCGISQGNRFIVITSWAPELHFMRSRSERSSIFTLLLLQYYERLPIPNELFELIVRLFVVPPSDRTRCDVCEGWGGWGFFCIKCENTSSIFVDCKDLVKYL